MMISEMRPVIIVYVLNLKGPWIKSKFTKYTEVISTMAYLVISLNFLLVNAL